MSKHSDDQKTQTTQKNTDNTFFVLLDSILVNKKYWMTGASEEKEYNQFGVNTGISQHLDTILYVNELNQFWQFLTPRMHYDYLFHSIRRMSRKKEKWAKRPQKSRDIDCVREYYGVNKTVAIEYLKRLDAAQLEFVRASCERGTN